MVDGAERLGGPELIPDDLLRQIWERSPDGMSLTDAEGVHRYVNPAYCAMVGRPAEELLGQRLLELAPPEYRAMYIGFYKALGATGGGSDSGELQVRRGDGQLATLLVRHSLLEMPGGPVHLLVSRDVTEQKAFEQHRERAEQMRTLGTLAGGVAHEFNNLLVSILGYAELIQVSRGPSLEVLLEFARKIQRAAQRGRELTAQLLPFARLEARQRRSVDLHQVIRESVDLFQLSAPDIAVRLALDPAPATVLGDAVQLHQVFLNVLVSAATGLEAGQPIVLETRLVQESLRRGEQQPITPYDFVLIDVSPQPVRESRTAGSRQRETAAAEPFDRTGLSMALVQGSIASHGGWLAAEPGHLKLWLPALTQASPAAAAPGRR
jgi:two-component system, cell cycle sensor histidine kinase and response regulator CckA